MLRPVPPIASSAFPMPIQNSDGSWGDVENLQGKATHQYDSMWIDLDAPVRYWRGRLYKPLFAFLVTDLDGRINVNTAGNNKGSGMTSYQGHGPWEVNHNYVLDGTVPTQNLTTGGGNQTLVGGGLVNRYRGTITAGNPTPIYSLTGTASNSTPIGPGVPYYSVIDFDASVSSSTGLNSQNQLAFPLQQYYTSPTFPGRDDINGVSGGRQRNKLHRTAQSSVAL